MVAVGAQAFDRDHLLAGGVAERGHAGAHGLAIDMDRAGAAQPGAAAEFRPGEPEFVADVPEQRHVRVAVVLVVDPVDVELDHDVLSSLCTGHASPAAAGARRHPRLELGVALYEKSALGAKFGRGRGTRPMRARRPPGPARWLQFPGITINPRVRTRRGPRPCSADPERPAYAGRAAPMPIRHEQLGEPDRALIQRRSTGLCEPAPQGGDAPASQDVMPDLGR